MYESKNYKIEPDGSHRIQFRGPYQPMDAVAVEVVERCGWVDLEDIRLGDFCPSFGRPHLERGRTIWKIQRHKVDPRHQVELVLKNDLDAPAEGVVLVRYDLPKVERDRISGVDRVGFRGTDMRDYTIAPGARTDVEWSPDRSVVMTGLSVWPTSSNNRPVIVGLKVPNRDAANQGRLEPGQTVRVTLQNMEGCEALGVVWFNHLVVDR